jgi:anti-anti-sigma factor
MGPMSSPLDVLIEAKGEVQVLHLSGNLDGTGAPVLETALERLLGRRQFRLVLDLATVQYLASAGVSLLIGAQRRCSAEGGRVVLLDPSPMAVQILATLGLGSHFPIARSSEQALTLARAPATSATASTSNRSPARKA